jgi:hypothetical protein
MLVAFWLGVNDVLYSLGLFRTTYIHAEYPSIRFSGEGDEFSLLYTGGRDPGYRVAPFYIRFNSEKTFFAPTISRKDIARIASKKEESEMMDGRPITHFYLGASGDVAFSDEHLLYVTFDDRDAFEISRSRDDGFQRLPIRRKTMIQMFGRPKSYRYSHPKAI